MIKLVSNNHNKPIMNFLSPIIAILLTLLFAGLTFYIMGLNPIKTLTAFFITPIKTTNGLCELLLKASPMIIIALGLSFCYKANQWNIGGEGQLVCGAIVSSALAIHFVDVDSWWVIYVVIAGGITAGMFWAAIPAFLKIHLKTNEILTSLMLSYIALELLQFVIYGPLKDPSGFGFPESIMFNDNSTISTLLNGTRLHKGVLLAPIITAIVYLLMNKHIFGYRVKLTGLSPIAAKYSGVNTNKIIWSVFLLSGALAGLAGSLEVTGIIGQLVPTVSPGYGFTAIIVAFLGRLNPIGIVLAGLIIALTYLGGESLQIANINDLKLYPEVAITSIPKAVGDVFQGAILFFLLMTEILMTHKLVFTNYMNISTRGSK